MTPADEKRLTEIEDRLRTVAEPIHADISYLLELVELLTEQNAVMKAMLKEAGVPHEAIPK